MKTTEGEVIVQAVSGGQTSVGAGQEVQIAAGGQAPANPSPQPQTPRLRFTPSVNVGFTVIDPRGLQCSVTVRQIPGCNFSGAVVSIDGPASGRYALALTAAAPGETLTVDALRGGGTDFSTRFTTDLALGDIVRTTIGVTVPADGASTTTGFIAGELVTTVCGAEARGRVFSSGPVEDRGAPSPRTVERTRSSPPRSFSPLAS